MAKDPAFPFYASDWLGSNYRAQMTLSEQGAYINLLARQWADPTCSLPADDKALAHLSGAGEGWIKGGYTLVKERFPPHPDFDGRLANTRLLELWAERQEWIEKSRKGGQRSALKRWGHKKLGKDKGGYEMVVTKPQPNGNPPSPSPSPYITPISPLQGTEEIEPKKHKKHKKPNEDYSKPFEEFWSAYPPLRKQGKRAAWLSWQKAIKRSRIPAMLPSVILQAVREYATSPKGMGNSPAPTVWLNQNRWEDDRAAWQDSGEDVYGPRNPHPPVDGPCREY